MQVAIFWIVTMTVGWGWLRVYIVFQATDTKCSAVPSINELTPLPSNPNANRGPIYKQLAKHIFEDAF